MKIDPLPLSWYVQDDRVLNINVSYDVTCNTKEDNVCFDSSTLLRQLLRGYERLPPPGGRWPSKSILQ